MARKDRQLHLSLRKAAISFCLGALAIGNVEAQQQKLKVSGELAAPLSRVQRALERKDWDEALAGIEHARSLPNRTPDDDRAINKLFYSTLKMRAKADADLLR